MSYTRAANYWSSLPLGVKWFVLTGLPYGIGMAAAHGDLSATISFLQFTALTGASFGAVMAFVFTYMEAIRMTHGGRRSATHTGVVQTRTCMMPKAKVEAEAVNKKQWLSPQAGAPSAAAPAPDATGTPPVDYVQKLEDLRKESTATLERRINQTK